MRRFLALLLLGLPLAAGAQESKTGLLIVAHGAGIEWNARIRQTVAQVSWQEGPIGIAFLMGPEAQTAGWDQAVASLVQAGAREIVVVPLMVSSHGGHVRQIAYYAGQLQDLPAELATHGEHARHTRAPVPMRVTSALDAAPELGVALAARWSELPDADRQRSLLLVAHGPSTDLEAAAWIRNLTAAASVLPVAGMGHEVRVGLLRDDAAPAVRQAAVEQTRDSIIALSRRSGDSVVVLPVLLSSGPILDVTIPKDLAGLPIRYSRTPLAPLPSLARWIERVAADQLLGPVQQASLQIPQPGR